MGDLTMDGFISLEGSSSKVRNRVCDHDLITLKMKSTRIAGLSVSLYVFCFDYSRLQ